MRAHLSNRLSSCHCSARFGSTLRGLTLCRLLGGVGVVALALANGCASDDATQSSGLPSLGTAGTLGIAGVAGAGSSAATCLPSCSDFPQAPIFGDESTHEGTPPPTDAARYFGEPESFTTLGVCVLEPELSAGNRPGALFPRNWLRPRFRFTPLPNEDLWEIRLRAPGQANTLVAYTTRTSWALPRDIWKALSQHTLDVPITVTIRGVDTRSPAKPSGTRGSFAIANAEARGTIVYWATTSSEVKPDTSKLVGFDVGDEGVIDALTIPDLGERGILAAGGRELRGMYDDPKGVAPGHPQCIGCHVSTPDGKAVAFTDHWPWNAVLADVTATNTGARPDYLSEGAELLLNQPWLGMQTFSPAHFSAGDRIALVTYSPRNQGHSGVGFADGAPYPSRNDGLAWFDLETMATFSFDAAQGDAQQQLNSAIASELGKSFGLLALEGETRSVAAPSFSHDGSRIAYTSADVTQDGRLGAGNSEVDLHMVPYANRRGGEVMPIAGAAEPGVAEYYPAFSADDSLIAFTRVAKIDDSALYYRPDGEVYLVPSAGGRATRVLGNDPPACGGETSPGVINSWPKWSPGVTRVAAQNAELGSGARTYYWLVFSSARAYEGQFDLPKTQYSPPDTRASQLYVSAVVRDEDSGELYTYPAIYLWNQDPSTSNLTPAWDELDIPPVPGPD